MTESELFGYKRGAFTGALNDKAGLFEVSHQGTLFLDEISELPSALQSKLLRVIQEREIRRVGDLLPKNVDVRIIVASNKNLQEEVKKRKFQRRFF